jgi:hypothetical protein
MTRKELKQALNSIGRQIKSVMDQTEYSYCDDLSTLTDYNTKDPDELFELDEMKSLMYHLADVLGDIEYLQLPVKRQGTLRKNASGRYEFAGRELTCGCGLEYLVADGKHYGDNWEPIPYWRHGRLEHDGNDYYIVGAPKDLQLDGLKVRQKG